MNHFVWVIQKGNAFCDSAFSDKNEHFSPKAFLVRTPLFLFYYTVHILRSGNLKRKFFSLHNSQQNDRISILDSKTLSIFFFENSERSDFITCCLISDYRPNTKNLQQSKCQLEQIIGPIFEPSSPNKWRRLKWMVPYQKLFWPFTALFEWIVLLISNFLQILSFQPRISKVFSITRTIFSHSKPEQFW